MSAFELLYQIVILMERMAVAMERSAAVHEKMLDKMEGAEETHVSTSFV